MKIPSYDDLGKYRKKDDNEKKEREYMSLHPFYKQLSRTLICGPSGSGKTCLLTHILLEPLIYWEQLVIYTKTPQQPKYIELGKIFDDIAKKAKIPKFYTITNGDVVDPDTLDEKAFKLVCFDDMILEKKQFDKIIKYFVLGRHKKCSCIFLSQAYYSTSKNIRTNCSHFHIFNVPTKREVRSILMDHAGITEQQYNDNTKNHDFISIDKIGKKIFRNIDEELI